MSKREDKDTHRQDISDEFWSKLEPLLPGRKDSWGGQAKDNRRFINAVYLFCEQERPGEICRHCTEAGRTRIAGFVDGEAKASGRN